MLRRGLRHAEALDERVDAELEAAEAVGARLVTVLDEDYPANLRLIPNLPPFLFIRGEIEEADTRSVAVVGTRQASEAGIRRARRMSTLLAEHQVTVVSGLARGIDTAAHRSALDSGGRTLAVLGTGITRCYPAENRDLAEEITRHGALVSQFWPTRSPGRDTFPRRNVVTSGLSQGTVVIEASSTSGAKMQARLALEHGKKVFLLRSLVTDQKWARTYVQERGAVEVGDVEDVIRQLASPDRVRRVSEQRQQLTFRFCEAGWPISSSRLSAHRWDSQSARSARTCTVVRRTYVSHARGGRSRTSPLGRVPSAARSWRATDASTRRGLGAAR